MDTLQETFAGYKPYINDIARRVWWVVIVFAVTFATSLYFVADLVRSLIKLFSFENVTIVVTTPFQLFNVAIDVSFLIATGVAVPFLLWNAYAFLRPGLTARESRAILALVPLSIILFLTGCAFGALSLYWGLQFMALQASFFGVGNFWDIGIFLSQLAWTAALLGVLFQFPIVLALCMKLGFVSSDFLRDKRPAVYALVLLLVALLPPSDGLSLIAMALPLLGMFELTVFLYRNA